MKKIINAIAFYFGFNTIESYGAKDHFFGVGGYSKKLEHFNGKEKAQATEDGNLETAIKRATDLDHLEIESLEDFNLENYEGLDSSCYEGYENLLQQDLDSFCHAEGLDMFDNYENADSVENAQRRRKRKRVGFRMKQKHGRKGGAYTAHKLGAKSMTGSFSGVKGSITISVTRNSFNLPYFLYVELFDYLSAQAGYPLISQYLPLGVTFVGATVNANGSITFTFNDTGTHTIIDTVTVTATEVPYNTFLTSTITDKYQTGGGQPSAPSGTIVLSDPSQQALQMAQVWRATDYAPLGDVKADPVNSGAFFSANQFQQGVLEVKYQFPIDRQKGLLFPMAFVPGSAPGYTLTATWYLMFAVIVQSTITGYKGRR